MGPFDQAIAWNSRALAGSRKFLERVWRVFDEPDTELDEKALYYNIMHKTIKIVGEHLDEFKFNTAISQLMILTNELTTQEKLPRKVLEDFAILISPFAPHLAEEVWSEVLGKKTSIQKESWPEFDEKFLVEDMVTYVVQINGKVRGDFEIDRTASKEEAMETAKKLEKVQKYLNEGEIKKEIFVEGKIVGFVVK